MHSIQLYRMRRWRGFQQMFPGLRAVASPRISIFFYLCSFVFACSERECSSSLARIFASFSSIIFSSLRDRDCYVVVALFEVLKPIRACGS